LFLTKFLLPFEVSSIILLAAAIGAVVLARRRRGLEPDESIERRIETPRPVWTGTMAEAAGLRVPTQEEWGPPDGDRVGTAPDPSSQEGGW
jgi:NADH-quinone oxidoreductase subunit J